MKDLITSREIRNSFLDFFKGKDHRIIPSASVIPYDDPTLLFTNAGMNQFKDVFLGIGKRDYVRCADTQKCIRVSGKHNDLEEVGHDDYHHTFFEMLGNWSFGDYYKKEALKWAWELLTDVWKMPKERLWATVYKTDEEALELWKSETDIDHSHILKFGEKDNFWEMGETGPCGPCSEIHFDMSKGGCKAGDVNSGDPDVIEIWNLVFIQYNKDDKGVLQDLPQRHIDTGMGFERVVRILQNKKSNYETDVFLPLINELINITGFDYSGNFVAPMNVIADHVRMLSFAIADGGIPSNEGRGYVIRRVLRRAARYGRKLNMKEPFIYKLVDVLAENMGYYFTELNEKLNFIKTIIKREEESFNDTLDRGLLFFNSEINKLEEKNGKVFPGEAAFKLHDTYGFPVDLTQLLARESGFELDVKEFEKFMNIQKERSRAARKVSNIHVIDNLSNHEIHYDPYHINIKGVQTEILIPEEVVKETGVNEPVPVFIKDNPFYSESGGQVSDRGIIILEEGKELEVIDSKKDYILVRSLNIHPGEYKGLAKVDLERRKNIEKNHSATHIVHEALRQVLGSHVKQMGSYLDDKFLRFDFPHYNKVTDEQMKDIDYIVNEKIRQGINVYDEIMPIEKAEKIPKVKKFFGEKYGDNVRVVFIDEKFSVEFCGGTHVMKTSDIGLFKITKEESVSSGVRRIFARTGKGVLDYINDKMKEIEHLISELPENNRSDIKKYLKEFNIELIPENSADINTIKQILNSQDQTISSLYQLKEQIVQEKKEIEKQSSRTKVNDELKAFESGRINFENVNGLRIFKKKYSEIDMESLKEIGDWIRMKFSDCVALLYYIADNKINFVVVAGDTAIKEKNIDAGKITREFAKLIGGGGGGKKHLATGGGKNRGELDIALKHFNKLIET